MYHHQVTRYRKNTAHGFHIFMSIITLGAWFSVVYAPLPIIRSVVKRKEVTTTYQYPAPYGQPGHTGPYGPPGPPGPPPNYPYPR
ncbi:hypothetical protein BKA25_001279 [Actinoalloteichus hymeniacidonis]|uniref:Uncharacterized protein n=1 Tax=Actinoalloteichus hymeniacidonis TaxID=340345 RepID=A0AAC9HSP4_9PSEU|nr:hypothetical protein TL08_20855 [Actinoalloteichus hymeniacidonis]MBB5906963.1 hypothetical protein [Actinoalloteichus hymeniacidonis]